MNDGTSGQFSHFPWLGASLLMLTLLMASVLGFRFILGAIGEKSEVEKRVVREQILSTSKDDVSIVATVDTEPRGADLNVLPATEKKQSIVALPPLHSSDDELKNKIASLDSGAKLLALMVSDELIRKIVRAVHGLSEGYVVKEFRPLMSPKGAYAAEPTGLKTAQGASYYVVSDLNQSRYAPYLNLLESIQPTQAASLYLHFFPLFQQAYEELGLRDPDFHSATLRAIELLKAPLEEKGVHLLRRPSVMYIYDNNDLENSSGVTKLKYRLGQNAHQNLVKWLVEFERLVREHRHQRP